MPSITATTTERCPCCSLPNTLQCRVRGGTATLIGHDEFTDVSTPPKKYRTKTYGGTTASEFRLNSDCTGTLKGIDLYTLSGSIAYDVTTGAVTNTANENYQSDNCGGGGPYTININYAPAARLGTRGGGILTVTTTRLSESTGIAGCGGFAGSCGYRVATATSETLDLSDEDAESDAINRLLASAAWGSWTNSGAGGCTGTPPSCCLAKYQSRTSGFSFDYYESEARVTATGLTPSTGYTAKIELYRRTYGTGSYTHYQTATVTGTSDGAGALTTSAVTVTNTKGYETYAHASSLFVT